MFSKCDQIGSFLWILSHLLKKSLMENFIFFVQYKSENLIFRPGQFDFSFCGPARVVFYSNWNKNNTHTHTHTHAYTHKNVKSLLVAKIWFMLSFRSNRRNRVFFRSEKVVNKEYILKYCYLCSLLAVFLLPWKWKRILDFIYIYKTVLGLPYTVAFTTCMK